LGAELVSSGFQTAAKRAERLTLDARCFPCSSEQSGNIRSREVSRQGRLNRGGVCIAKALDHWEVFDVAGVESNFVYHDCCGDHVVHGVQTWM